MLVVLNNQMLLSVLFGGDNTGFALVETSTGARPIHLLARHFVFGVRVIADFEFSGAPETGDEPHVCWKKKKILLEWKNR